MAQAQRAAREPLRSAHRRPNSDWQRAVLQERWLGRAFLFGTAEARGCGAHSGVRAPRTGRQRAARRDRRAARVRRAARAPARASKRRTSWPPTRSSSSTAATPHQRALSPRSCSASAGGSGCRVSLVEGPKNVCNAAERLRNIRPLRGAPGRGSRPFSAPGGRRLSQPRGVGRVPCGRERSQRDGVAARGVRFVWCWKMPTATESRLRIARARGRRRTCARATSFGETKKMAGSSWLSPQNINLLG
jgi:hypothetical protein